MTVKCPYAERTRAWPVATRWSLPAGGAAAEERCKQAQVPQAVSFQTKAAIALALLDEATRCGVKHACVTGAAD